MTEVDLPLDVDARHVRHDDQEPGRAARREPTSSCARSSSRPARPTRSPTGRRSTRPGRRARDAGGHAGLYVLPGRGYVMTFAAPPDRANDYAQAVADIATSFTIRPEPHPAAPAARSMRRDRLDLRARGACSGCGATCALHDHPALAAALAAAAPSCRSSCWIRGSSTVRGRRPTGRWFLLESLRGARATTWRRAALRSWSGRDARRR